ncbi:ATP-grasp domain-containing protein [Paenibacillus macerans]|uniref:ATP-grasp domain-containing protein n=1 Tax=Paenibacillus macerans TaxID=44252 RepID=UPI002E1E9B4A|nr:ATP-grasp domain-containing protein [Paenibacillus macerans]
MEHILFIEATLTGAGLKAVQIAKDKNLYVTLFTRQKHAYETEEDTAKNILFFVDRVIETDTNDVDKLCQEVRRLNEEKPVTAIITTADFYVPQAAAVAEMLHLPSIPYEAALKVRNKFRMREELSRIAPELNPAFFLVGTLSQAKEKAKLLNYPLILKPQDENDSVDVLLIQSDEELEYHFLRVTSKPLNRAGQVKTAGGVLLEEYIGGQEYSVETFQGAPNRPLQLMGITRKYLLGTERGHFVEVGHCFPVNDHREKIFAAVSKALKGLGIHTSACHTEIKVVDGQPKIIEINPRLAGGGIGSHLIELATEVNPLSLIIDAARGLAPLWEASPHGGAAIYKLAAHRDGTIKTLPDLSLFDSDDVVEINIPLKRRQTVRLPKSNGDLLGYVITRAASADEALDSARNLTGSISLDIE